MKPKKQQTRRRSKRAHDAIIAATLALLTEKGYFGLSIEGIAVRAGVGKQTIYRWWPTKAALVIEAYFEMASSNIQVPDTGAVESDLVQLLATIFSRISTAPSAQVMSGLIAEAQVDPDLAKQFYTGFIEGRREVVIRLIKKGIKRGEVRPDTDTEIAVDSLFGPMWYRLLIGHAPLDQDFSKQLVRQFLSGVSTND